MFKTLFFCMAFPSSLFAQEPSTLITGYVELNNPISWIYISYNSFGSIIKDSIYSKKNKFVYKMKINEGSTASIVPKRNIPAPLIKEEPVLLYVCPGDKIKLSVNNNFHNYTSSGTATNDDFQKMVNE